jgi:hypothetical protein
MIKIKASKKWKVYFIFLKKMADNISSIFWAKIKKKNRRGQTLGPHLFGFFSYMVFVFQNFFCFLLNFHWNAL